MKDQRGFTLPQVVGGIVVVGGLISIGVGLESLISGVKSTPIKIVIDNGPSTLTPNQTATYTLTVELDKEILSDEARTIKAQIYEDDTFGNQLLINELPVTFVPRSKTGVKTFSLTCTQDGKLVGDAKPIENEDWYIFAKINSQINSKPGVGDNNFVITCG